MERKNEHIYEVISDSAKSSKPIKAVVFIALAIGGLYIAGHVFKVFAYTIRGFKDFSSALKE